MKNPKWIILVFLRLLFLKIKSIKISWIFYHYIQATKDAKDPGNANKPFKIQSKGDEGSDSSSKNSGGEKLTPTNAKKRCRTTYNLHAINVMVQWFNRNREYPYPSARSKIDLSSSTGLTIKQVDKWFNNTRCRIKKAKQVKPEVLTRIYKLNKKIQEW